MSDRTGHNPKYAAITRILSDLDNKRITRDWAEAKLRYQGLSDPEIELLIALNPPAK